MATGSKLGDYLRLEQGRDQHPSDQVLDSIARALHLEPDAETYMHELTRPPRATRRRLARPERVSASVQDLIDNWTTTPPSSRARI